MEAFKLVGNFLRWSVLAGGLGAGTMVLILWGIAASGLVKNANLVVAMGSLITRSYRKATLVGGLVHLFLGVFFGECYAFLLMGIDHPGIGTNLVIGAGLGLFHGMVMAMFLMAVVPEVHPLEEFQKRGFPVAMSYWVAHVGYGAVVGAVIGASLLIKAQT